MLGRDAALLVTAMTACLKDTHGLVQRQALELLTVHFPLDAAYARWPAGPLASPRALSGR